MKEWLTAREIAAEALPDLPTTESAVIRYAERSAWDTHLAYARPRKGRGGGIEYHYRILPTLAQVAYVQRYMVVGVDSPAPTACADAPIIAGKAGIERDARLAVIAAFETFSRGLRLNRQACIAVFCDRYQMGFIKIDDWVKDKIPSVSRRSLWRWMSVKNTGKTESLAVDRSKARAGSGLLETANGGEVKAFILAWIASNPALSAETIQGYVKDHFGAELIDRNGELKALPPLRTFQHFIKHLSAAEKVVITKISNPDKFRSTMKLSGTGALRHISEPNALWQIDASPVDALCLDGRHSLYACIDIATRRLVITLSKTPRASAVGLLIRKAILKLGVAHVIKTDNGSDFVAIATKQLFANLDITPDVSDAYSPEQKGHVERVIKTFQHEVGPQLPGYIGHSVAERKSIEERKSFSARLGADDKDLFEVALTAEQLQRHIDDWLEYRYHEREHDGLKQRIGGSVVKRSPNQVAAASNAVIRRVEERALDALLMPVAGKDGMRRMTKQGIKIDGFYYLCGSILPGSDVFVRLDPIDMGKVYAFAASDGRFLDIALCPELADVNPQAYVKAQKQIAADHLREREREIKADIRALKKGPSGIERTIRLAKAEAQERAASTANVIQMPKREEQHTTPAIEAALDALDAADGKAIAQADTSELHAKIHEKIMEDLTPKSSGENVSAIRKSVTPAQRFRRFMEIDSRIKAGGEVSVEEAYWAGSYKETAECKVQQSLFDDFGDQAPGLRT